MVWDKIAKIGTFIAMDGQICEISNDTLEQIVRNFGNQAEKVPIVYGHPSTDAPAVGWIKDLRVKDGFLEAQYEKVSDEFKEAVNSGKFRYKSIAIDKTHNKLRHLGILGAVAPAMSGLGEIQFQRHNNSIVLFFADNNEDYMNIEEFAKKLETLEKELKQCKSRIDMLEGKSEKGGQEYEQNFSQGTPYIAPPIASKL